MEKENPAFAALSKGSFAIRTDQYKLICYRGYGQYGGADHFELYDMRIDPDELNDLYTSKPSIVGQLREELLSNIAAADKKLGL